MFDTLVARNVDEALAVLRFVQNWFNIRYSFKQMYSQ